jgi:hypothetical protein
MGRPRKRVAISLELFQEIWKYLQTANPGLAQKLKAYIVAKVFKGKPIPEEWGP